MASRSWRCWRASRQALATAATASCSAWSVEATAAVLPAIEGKKRILLIAGRHLGHPRAAPALALDLEQNGHEIYITADQAPGYGDAPRHRRQGLRRGDLYRTSVTGGMAPGTGKVVCRGDINATAAR